MPTAEESFTRTFSRFFRNWAFITSLRQVADVAIPAGSEALAAVHANFVDKLATEEPYKNLIVGSGGSSTPWGEDLKVFLKFNMTSNAITDARSAIDAASLIFAQSMLDDCALSQLKTCAIFRPTDWEILLEGKKIVFADLAKPFEEIREELIQAKVLFLERESLLSKRLPAESR